MFYRCAFVLLDRMHGAAVAASLLVIGALESAKDPTGSIVIAEVVPAQAQRQHFAVRSKKAE